MAITDPVAPIITTPASDADTVDTTLPAPAGGSAAPQIGPSSLNALAGINAAPAAPTLPTTPAVPTPVPATPATINTSNTQSTQPIQYSVPQTPPVYPVSTLSTAVPTAPLTPSEDDAQSLTDQLETLNNSLTSEPGDQTAANTAAGVDSDNATINDLNAQLTGLKNEAAAIPLQLQTDSQGRGITTGGLAPISSAALRNNATQALTISTLLSAAQGNLANAQAQANQVIAQKYGPIEAQITSATANLKLILSSPEYTNEEKAQAQDQLNQQTNAQNAVDQAKADSASILSIATTAAANGADAVTLQKITNATTPAQALAIASGSGFYAKAAAVKTQVATVNGETLLINSDTGETIKDLGPADSTAAQSSSKAITAYQGAFVAGSTFQGTNVNGQAQTFQTLNANGTLTTQAFSAAIDEAPSQGLSRADFLTAFGYLLVDPKTGTIDPSYGLTQTEIKKITGTAPTT